ncbi:DNA-binding protein [Fictibacillus nanhaiensis]|uniref:DNA-binding protein n=1 Tax=Fictibacillus nanhaiensis TaxID=742169 RepID=UPI00203C1E00|nr:DNA-binding protein [Fictibacillus nanhaiensis]MCM3731889.1 DNA-binding protein [Fictibacillus nanhaiensis]
MEISLLWVGLGLAALGYFIGEGLKHFKNPGNSFADYPVLIKETDLHNYVGLKLNEVEELLRKYPDIPSIELKGTRYYQYHHVYEWLSAKENFKQRA